MNTRVINALYFLGGVATATLACVLYNRQKVEELKKDAENRANKDAQEIARLQGLVKRQRTEIADLTDDSIPIVKRQSVPPMQRVRYEIGPPAEEVFTESDEGDDEVYIPGDQDYDPDEVDDEIDWDATQNQGYLGIIPEEEYKPVPTYAQVYMKYILNGDAQGFMTEEGSVWNYQEACRHLSAALVQEIAGTYNRNPIESVSMTFHVRNADFRSDYIINRA